MIVLGLVALIIGVVLGFGLLVIIGVVLLVIGAVFAIAGASGRAIGGRRRWY
jgi:hypothetical protein